jgi:ABC-type multidrug transport system permease subunit
MFKRLNLEDWGNLVPMIAFGVLATFFLFAMLWALRLRPAERKRMANLPLQDSKDHSDP